MLHTLHTLPIEGEGLVAGGGSGIQVGYTLPPSPELQKLAVRILLECFIVYHALGPTCNELGYNEKFLLLVLSWATNDQTSHFCRQDLYEHGSSYGMLNHHT